MGNVSAIEWTDATWNPVTGCTKVSAGCKNCYAERDFHRPYPGRDFTDVRCHPERLDWPLRWRGSKQAKAEGRPSRIFVNSMSDLFHENVPVEFIKSVRGIMFEADRHTFQVLTKRPRRMGDFVLTHCQFTKNVWLGVSVEDQKAADERIPLLLQTPAAVRFASYEPALGPVDFSRYLSVDFAVCGARRMKPEGLQALAKLAKAAASQHGIHALDWVIAGGESGPKARPAHPDWFRSARDQCQAAGVPFFFKQWGEWIHFSPGDAADKVFRDRIRLTDGHGGVFCKLGKKNTGRSLDGREWNEFPK